MIEDSARDIGLAFQIRDDILDVTSTTDELGKPVFSDEKNDKTTYVTIEGIEKAKSDMEVELCPVSKLSQLLSQRFGKPLIPPNLRRFAKFSLRPVSSLCV